LSSIITPGRGPLIKVAPYIPAGRDPEIYARIEYFDQPEIKGNWSKLTKKDVLWMDEEVGRIQNGYEGFVYAARNYFWIKTKEQGERLFSLWPSQELLLQTMSEMRAKGLPQKVMIIKSRKLGFSTLVEALIAWKTMFFCNQEGLVISFDPEGAAYLFGMMQLMYDRMPWWLKPMCSSREIKEGLKFENPKYSERGNDPGLNSMISVQGANKKTGIGQGMTLSACHFSEFADVDDKQCKQIISEDMGNALGQGPGVFAVLESTAKGAGRYSHWLWLKMIERGDMAEWRPEFFPFFFDRTNFLPPPQGWHVEPDEADIRERAAQDWVRCDIEDCGRFQNRFFKGEDRAETTCSVCQKGTLKSHFVEDGYLFWMHRKRKNAEGDPESMSLLLQEQASNAEAAFIVSGNPVFPADVQKWAASRCTDNYVEVLITPDGHIHCNNPHSQRCIDPDCEQDHTFDVKPIKIWEWPQKDARYVMGGDPAHGNGGEADYAVGSVIKVPSQGADIQVAVFRSNNTDPVEQAMIWNFLGRHYNNALLAVEANKLDMVASDLRTKWNYPNLYRERNVTTGAATGRYCWITDEKSKPRIYLHMRRWLKQKLFEPRSRNFAEEMKFFRKEDTESDKAGAIRKFKDDEVMATQIAEYVAHENDWDENLGMVRVKNELTLQNCTWHMACTACTQQWPSNYIASEKTCPYCGSMHISARQNPDYEKPVEEPGEEDFLAQLNQLLKESTMKEEDLGLDYNLL
jgi:hypothetical protein